MNFLTAISVKNRECACEAAEESVVASLWKGAFNLQGVSL
jgi:hypothetical protein